MARTTGLEITETSVRVVELDGSPRKYRIVSTSDMPIPEGGRESPDVLAQTVRAAFKAAKAKKDQVIVGIPARDAIIREIVIPFTDVDQIRKVIKFESEGHLHGVDIEDVVVDFQKVAEMGPRSRVLIIAVKKETVQQYLEILSRAGIDPQQVDLDAAALFSLALLIPEVEEVGSQGQVILDIGEVTSTVIVSQGEHLRMVRCMRIGSNSLVRSLAADLGIEREEARTVTQQFLQMDEPFVLAGGKQLESSKALTTTALQDDIIKDKGAQFEQRIVNEIKRSLSSIQMEGKLGAIWLTGPASTAPGLEVALRQGFGVQVAHLDTLGPADHKLSERAALHVGTASGLALKGLGHDPLHLDFRQEELRFTRKFEKVQVPLVLAGLFIFLGLAFLTIDAHLQIRSHKELINHCGDQAIHDLQKILIDPADKDSVIREIMGYESLDEIRGIIPKVKRRERAKWVSQVRASLTKPTNKILENYGIEVGTDSSSGPETKVVSTLKRIRQIANAIRRAKPRIGDIIVDRMRFTPREAVFDVRVSNVRGWDELEKEFKKIPGFDKAEIGSQSFFEGKLWELKGCKVQFIRE